MYSNDAADKTSLAEERRRGLNLAYVPAQLEGTLFAWSGGKDSAMALHELKRSGAYKIQALLTTITKDYDRISMHGVRCTLLEAQAESIGLPLEKVFITKDASHQSYEDAMRETLLYYRKKGVGSVVFGDIFLEDVRAYRQKNLAGVGMEALFPLWKKDTQELADAFIKEGFKAVVTCVDTKLLDGSFAGREYDEDFVSALPAGVDPCGENGEFHSFVYAGPIFKKSIAITRGEIVLRDSRFVYCDLVPAGTTT